jgi:hypothetical protein
LFEDLSAYKISWFTLTGASFAIHLKSLEVPPSPYSKDPSKKVMIHIKLVGVSRIFYG